MRSLCIFPAGVNDFLRGRRPTPVFVLMLPLALGSSRPIRSMARTANQLASTPGLASSLGPLALATRGTASTQVYDAVRAAIVRGILPPGTAMSEVEIGEMLHVSRTPVRETFRRLAAEGLLTVAPQVGTTVRKMSRQVLADALFIRETIECGAARLAVQAPEADRRAVLDIVRRQREAIGRNDVEGGLDRDEDLHKAIIDLSGHPAPGSRCARRAPTWNVSAAWPSRLCKAIPRRWTSTRSSSPRWWRATPKRWWPRCATTSA